MLRSGPRRPLLKVHVTESALATVMRAVPADTFTAAPRGQLMRPSAQFAGSDCVTVYVPGTRFAKTRLLGRSRLVSSSSEKDPSVPLNAKSCGPFGTESSMMVID